VVEWLTVLRIREAPAQISARRTAVLTEMFRGFSQSSQANLGIIP